MTFPATTPTGMMGYGMVSSMTAICPYAVALSSWLLGNALIAISFSHLTDFWPQIHHFTETMYHLNLTNLLIKSSSIPLQPPQMGSMGLMNPPSMMYNQPVMRPPNPFGSVSSAQVSVRQHRV